MTMIISPSEQKAFQACPKKHEYKYRYGIQPKRPPLPLRSGSWIHSCLEAYYKGEDWEKALEKLAGPFYHMFEEEKELYGDLPGLTRGVMEAYLRRYADEPWEILAVEPKLKTPLSAKQDVILTFRPDLIVRDTSGLVWVVDHKLVGRIPRTPGFRLLDPQLTLYPWGVAKETGWKADGTIYNYLRRKVPAMPQLLKDGSRLSARKADTDEFTFLTALKQYSLNPADYEEELQHLREYNPFFSRLKVPRETLVTKATLRDTLAVALMIRDYTHAPRNITRDCDGCSYLDLCIAETSGLEVDEILKRRFEIRIPEVKEEFEDGGDQD